MSQVPVWFNTNSAATYIGVTPATLYRLVQKGEVVGYQIGRVRRYQKSDLDRFLASARIRPEDGR